MAPLGKQKASSVQNQKLTHVTHKHPLKETVDNKEFICDGCNTLGSGKKFHCKKCKFDLHDYCATCSMTLSSHLHPKHPLTLVPQQPGPPTTTAHGPCDVCAEQVQGLFYACPTCAFIVHPLCTNFPSHVRHVIDAKHPLTFQSSAPSFCSICRDFCVSWRYRCEPCGFDIHPECFEVPYYSHIPPSAPGMPPSFLPRCNTYSYTMGTPATATYGKQQYQYQYHQQPPMYYNTPQDGGSTSGGRRRKKVYALVGRLAVGVVLTAVVGIPGISPFF